MYQLFSVIELSNQVYQVKSYESMILLFSIYDETVKNNYE